MRTFPKSFLVASGILLAAAIGACAPGNDAPGTDAPGTDAPGSRAGGANVGDAPAASPGVIDSTLPIDTLLHRFRATLADTPTVLAGGATSPERLARTLLTALSANDTATLRSLVISPAEFAWLYYPHTKWTRPPYEMGPELVWFQIGANSEKGLVRLVRRYGGTPLRYESLACPDSVIREGPNTVTEGCRVRFAAADSAARELRLFGSLLNRGGTYKFVAYSNDL